MNTPMIRFNGYDEEWEKKHLSELIDGGIHPEQYNNCYLEIGDIDAVQKSHTIDRAKEVVSGAKGAKDGTILLSTVRPTRGAITKLDENCYVSSGLLQIYISDEVKREVVFQILSQDCFFVSLGRLSTGSTYPTVSKDDVLKLNITIPLDINEQEQIGNFLSTFDGLISAEEDKMSLLEGYKEAMLQKMFPKKGMKLPEIRFEGYDEEWEEIKLGDVLISSPDRNVDSGDYPVITSSRDGLYRQDEYFDKVVASKDLSNYRLLYRDYFTYRSMSDDGNFTFNLNNICNIGLVSPAYPVFSFGESCDNNFMLNLLNSSSDIMEGIYTRVQGGTRLALGVNILKDFNVSLPSLEEQEQIGNFFKTLYDKIELQQKHIEDLHEVKESFLQKMFV